MHIAIVGGGLLGVSLAVVLRERGAAVTLFERARLGAGASGAAGGMLGAQAEIANRYDCSGQSFEALVQARELTLAWLTELEAEHGPVDLSREGIVRLAFSAAEAEELRAEGLRQRELGQAAEWLEPRQLRALVPNASNDALGALHLRGDAHLDPRLYLQRAAASAARHGVTLREGEAVQGVSGHRHGVSLHTASGQAHFTSAVVAAGSWSAELLPNERWSLRPIRGQMLDLRLPQRAFGPVLYGSGGYMIPRGDGRVTLGATMEDVGFDERLDPHALEALRAAAVRSVPVLAQAQVERSWCGFRPFSPDGALAEATSIRNTFVLSGHHRNGVLLARKSALELADALLSSTAG